MKTAAEALIEFLAAQGIDRALSHPEAAGGGVAGIAAGAHQAGGDVGAGAPRFGDGKFDRLDPAMDFALQGIVAESNAFRLTWSAMPGRSYQIVHSDTPAGGWNDLPDSLTNAGPLQTALGFADSRQITNSQRFYRVKLLP